jgi:hypothetical protein
MHRLPRPSPAMFVSLLALFFALGGTAFAVGSKELAAQPRCATGAIRGIAVVQGGRDGIANLPDSYTSSSDVFGFRWSCTGGQISVRRSPNSRIGYDVKFNGNPSSIAVVSSQDPNQAFAGSVSRNPDGSFHVVMAGSSASAHGAFVYQSTATFTIVLL